LIIFPGSQISKVANLSQGCPLQWHGPLRWKCPAPPIQHALNEAKQVQRHPFSSAEVEHQPVDNRMDKGVQGVHKIVETSNMPSYHDINDIVLNIVSEPIAIPCLPGFFAVLPTSGRFKDWSHSWQNLNRHQS